MRTYRLGIYKGKKVLVAKGHRPKNVKLIPFYEEKYYDERGRLKEEYLKLPRYNSILVKEASKKRLPVTRIPGL